MDKAARLLSELRALRATLPAQVRIVAGGSGARALTAGLARISAVGGGGIPGLVAALDAWRPLSVLLYGATLQLYDALHGQQGCLGAEHNALVLPLETRHDYVVATIVSTPRATTRNARRGRIESTDQVGASIRDFPPFQRAIAWQA